MTNILFLVHLGLYFGYKERVTLDENLLQVKQGFLRFSGLKIPLENIFSSMFAKVAWGIITLRVYYHDRSEAELKKVQIGAYLDEPHLEILTDSFDRMYSDKLIMGTE